MFGVHVHRMIARTERIIKMTDLTSIITDLEQRGIAIDKALFALRNIERIDEPETAPDWVTSTAPVSKLKVDVSAATSDGTPKVSPLKGRKVSAATRKKMAEGQRRRHAAKG
jgi:hypothetical protein